MIVAAGLTPAWQQIMRFDAVRPGEVNRAREVHWCASGKVLNVAIGLAHLGAPVRCVTVLGGATGQAIAEEIARMPIEASWIRTATPTRTCTTLLGRDGITTELVENAAPLAASEIEHFRAAVLQAAAGAELLVLTGSMPLQTPHALFGDVVRACGRRAILDIRGPELLETLSASPLLIKPNREELEHTHGQPLEDSAALHAVMRELNELGAEWVVVSQGKHTLWASSRGRIYRAVPPAVEAINPIGAGDSLAAGFAWAIREGKEPLEALRYGMAAAADNVTQLLPARISPERIMELARRIEIARVDG